MTKTRSRIWSRRQKKKQKRVSCESKEEKEEVLCFLRKVFTNRLSVFRWSDKNNPSNFIYRTETVATLILLLVQSLLVLVPLRSGSRSCFDVHHHSSVFVLKELWVQSFESENMNKNINQASRERSSICSGRKTGTKNTFQDLMSNIFTASHTLVPTYEQNTDWPITCCLSADQSDWCSADQSECIFSAKRIGGRAKVHPGVCHRSLWWGQIVAATRPISCYCHGKSVRQTF